MNVDLSDILDLLNRDEKLNFMNQQLTSIKTDTRSKYSCEHLVFTFASGDSFELDISTMPSADTAFFIRNVIINK